MSRLLKIAILWLLVFALPMQGFASSAMLDCGTAHQQLMSSASMHDEDSLSFAQKQQIHHHEQVSTNQDHQHVADASHAARGDLPADDSHHHSTGGKCSACASCCLSSAISAPATLDPIAALPTGLETSFQPDQQFTPHFPEGLERPPHSLAI